LKFGRLVESKKTSSGKISDDPLFERKIFLIHELSIKIVYPKVRLGENYRTDRVRFRKITMRARLSDTMKVGNPKKKSGGIANAS